MPKSQKPKQTGAKIDGDVLKLLKQKAKSEGRTLTWILNETLKKGLEK